ncbi:GAF domain-containing protein [Actinacidiphila paucisporea]|uniref:ANTAR domain-containing protein n=1 Tax=Actinacidiphila paucisporea TaxID=310782 RepID=A0A1M7LMM1_9ACTN|nr:GAF domain-containing protein [Actinacidiphila paucisporea]SHM79460.1 ANTAR domain-containing protein [Actinacidiphila paucisporea]
MDVTDTFGTDTDPLTLAGRLVDHCVRLTSASAAGLMLVDARDRLRPLVASDRPTEALLALELDAEAAPDLDCRHSGTPVVAAPLDGFAERWPRFTAAAADRGFRAVYAAPVRVGGHPVGVLSLLGAGPDAPSADEMELISALAAVALGSMMRWRAEPARPSDILTRVQSVISAKAAVETAVGMLAATGRTTVGEAARELERYCRHEGFRAAAVARWLLDGTVTPESVLAAARQLRGPAT